MPDFHHKVEVHAITPGGFVRQVSDEMDDDGDGWACETDNTLLSSAARVSSAGPVVVTCTDNAGNYRWAYLSKDADPEVYEDWVGGDCPSFVDVDGELADATAELPEALPRQARTDLALALAGSPDDGADDVISRWQVQLADAKAWRRLLRAYLKVVELPEEELFLWREPGAAGRHFLSAGSGIREVDLDADDDTGRRVAAFVPGASPTSLFLALHFGDPTQLTVKFPEVLPDGERPPTPAAPAPAESSSPRFAGSGGVRRFLKRLLLGDD